MFSVWNICFRNKEVQLPVMVLLLFGKVYFIFFWSSVNGIAIKIIWKTITLSKGTVKYRGIHAIIYWKKYHCKPLYSAEFSLFPVSKEQTNGSGIIFAGINYPLHSTPVSFSQQANGLLYKTRLITNAKRKCWLM